MRVIPVTKAPSIRVVAAPILPADAFAEALRCRAQIAEAGGLFDGPKLLVLAASGEEIVAYETTYAVRLAHHILADEDGISSLGLGSLGCWAMLVRLDGKMLIGKRTGHMLIEPGRWATSVTGGVSPGETPDEAIRREMKEEIGLASDEVPDLRPVAVCVGREPVGCSVLYRGTLPDGVILTPHESEIAELQFVLPDELPEGATTILPELIAVCRQMT